MSKQSQQTQPTGLTISISSEELEKLNLCQKLSLIRRTVSGFTKDTTGYQYKYVSGSQVLGKIKDAMDTLGILLVPMIAYETSATEVIEIKQIKSVKVGYNNGKPQYEDKEVTSRDYIVKSSMDYVWIDCRTGERLVVPWALFGQQDEISKAFGSGLTYSERYFILKFFNVPTDEDDPDSRQKPKDSGNGAPLVVVTNNPARDAELVNQVQELMGTDDVTFVEPETEKKPEPPKKEKASNTKPAKEVSREDMLATLRAKLSSSQMAEIVVKGNLGSFDDLKDADLKKLYGMVVKA